MLNFQARLINVKFDKENRNVLRFSTREAQQKYFDCASLFVDAPFVNFNAGSLLDTSIVYEVEEGASINDILSKNYCIIKDNTPNATLPYYYYHVESTMQDSGRQIKVRLRLDIFQTYYIDTDFTPCHINRAHLNRFVAVDQDHVAFDGNLTSKLFEGEDIKNFPKRLKSRQTFALMPDRFGGGIVPSEISQTNLTFCDNYLIGWAYVFLNSSILNVQFTGTGFPTRARTMREGAEGNRFVLPYVCLCFPLLRDLSSISVDMQRRYSLTYTWDFNTFVSGVLSQIESYILDVKISQTPPFPNFSYFDRYTIKNAVDTAGTHTLTIEDIATAEHANNVYGEFFALGKSDNQSGYMAYIVYQHDIGVSDTTYKYSLKSGMNSRTMTTPLTYQFAKSDIIGSKKDKQFNPKLLSQSFTELRVGQGLGAPQIYDPQKMNTNKVLVAWRESIVPAIMRIYIGALNNDLNNDENNIYNSETFKSLVGANIAQDTSFPYSINQLEQFLANNKNFYLQNTLNRATNFVQGLKLSSGNVGAIANNALSGIGDLISSKINEQLTTDNMANAPEAYKNIDGNPLLPMAINDDRTYIEIWQALDNEMEIANDYMALYGFTTNLIGKIKDFDNVRKYYNYIAADIEEIEGVSISNAVYDAFKQAFARGVRFWNVDTFEYDQENYENWLEEEQNV